MLVAWYQNEVQLGWSHEKGMVIVRMDNRPGSLSLTAETADTCYILLHLFALTYI